MNLRFRELLGIGLRNQTLRYGFCLDALGIKAAAIIGNLDNDVAAFVIGGKPDLPVFRLSGSAPLFRRLEAVVRRIAHHMRQRILDQVEHLAVELGFGALHFKLDLLAKLVGKVAHDARQLLPRIADRLHARLHHAFLQFGGHIGQTLQRRLEFGFLVAAHDLKQLIAREHQLGHHCHQAARAYRP